MGELQLNSLVGIDGPRKKLTGIDSQRILRVLDEYIIKLELLSCLPPALEQIDRLSIDLGADLRLQLIHYRSLIQKAGLERLSDKTESQATEVMQSIIRGFYVNPSAMSNLKSKFYKDQSPSFNEYIKKLKEFRSVLLDRLVTSRQEEVNRNQSLKVLEERREALSIDLVSINKEVQKAVSKRDTDLGKKNANLKYLKAEMETLQRMHQEDVQLARDETKKQKEQYGSNHLQRKQKLSEQEISQTKKLNGNLIANRQSEAVLRERKERIEQEVDNWIQRYDSDLGEKQDRIDDLTEQLEERSSDLKELDQKLFVLEKEYLVVVEERQKERKKIEEKDKLLKLQTEAVTKLQYYWRRYRKLHPKRPKSKKAKGKGKGKKGTKK
ncbi:hypothetical protein LOD99_1985 [Oopsacas minuta]|uniref:Dynein regulatory complex protein 10 n=1 Tax=Oopsacas minuta TaxID=111878 RepID=A0AAV7K3N0_9METZ|nr:hypothetical protein LOD99_1985 [Oopsacas minuta]